MFNHDELVGVKCTWKRHAQTRKGATLAETPSQPEHLLSFRWHPYAIEPGRDYTGEPTTLVEFRLEEVPEGILLVVTESGFDQIRSIAGPKPSKRMTAVGPFN